jgi:hypothetical protein
MWVLCETAVCAVFHRVHALCDRTALVRRTDLADRGMPAPLIME